MGVPALLEVALARGALRKQALLPVFARCCLPLAATSQPVRHQHGNGAPAGKREARAIQVRTGRSTCSKEQQVGTRSVQTAAARHSGTPAELIRSVLAAARQGGSTIVPFLQLTCTHPAATVGQAGAGWSESWHVQMDG